MHSQIESLLLSEVSLPGQYIGGELGSVVKPKDSPLQLGLRTCLRSLSRYGKGTAETQIAALLSRNLYAALRIRWYGNRSANYSTPSQNMLQ